MLNEWAEFQAYTQPVTYRAANKRDTSYLGRFTFDTLLDFEGMARVLVILARGFLFHDADGAALDGEARQRLDHARRALCAWCSVPEGKRAKPKQEWQYACAFPELSGEFPELVDEQGRGWLCRHVRGIVAFAKAHPDKISKPAADKCVKLGQGFEQEWRKKVMQFQTPAFAPTSHGQWLLRFDHALADALELGPLRRDEISLPPALLEKLAAITPAGVPEQILPTLVAYYIANKPDDADWVVLPVANFDAYFGTTTFSRKHLRHLPPEVIDRPESSFGLCRYRVSKEYLP